MALRISIGVLWLFVILGLAGASLLPRDLDIYIRDRYFPIHRNSVILMLVLLVIVPLLLLTVRLLQTKRLAAE